MFGGGSIQLGRVFGIRIGVDVSWFIVLFLIICSLSGYYEDVFPAARTRSCSPRSARCCSSSRSCCTSWATRWWRSATGSRSSGIDLWMFGGVAKLGRDTDSPGVEFRVAVAGPLVTLLIAAACFGAGALISSSDQVLDSSTLRERHGGRQPPPCSAT